jgi:hypothetical protein
VAASGRQVGLLRNSGRGRFYAGGNCESEGRRHLLRRHYIFETGHRRDPSVHDHDHRARRGDQVGLGFASLSKRGNIVEKRHTGVTSVAPRHVPSERRSNVLFLAFALSFVAGVYVTAGLRAGSRRSESSEIAEAKWQAGRAEA